jgi:hypothetical protein
VAVHARRVGPVLPPSQVGSVSACRSVANLVMRQPSFGAAWHRSAERDPDAIAGACRIGGRTLAPSLPLPGPIPILRPEDPMPMPPPETERG